MVAKACPEHSLDKSTTLVAVSGSGNVAQHTAFKLIELGATVLSLSDSKGSLISEKGFTKEFVQKIAQSKLHGGSLPDILIILVSHYHLKELPKEKTYIYAFHFHF